MKYSDVFYNDGIGVGIKFDGTCGFSIGVTKINDAEYRTLRICPLKHKQDVGELEEGNGIDKNGPFVDLVFVKPESIDVMIEALEIVKNNNKE